jgi:hypothetical protein
MLHDHIRCSEMFSRRPLLVNGHICDYVSLCVCTSEISAVYHVMENGHKMEEACVLQAPVAGREPTWTRQLRGKSPVVEPAVFFCWLFYNSVII